MGLKDHISKLVAQLKGGSERHGFFVKGRSLGSLGFFVGGGARKKNAPGRPSF